MPCRCGEFSIARIKLPISISLRKSKVLPVPFWLVVRRWFCFGRYGGWLMATVKGVQRRQACRCAYALHVFAPVVFGVGYLLICDINHGWLVLNIWHNCQYILTVWMFNNNRFKNQIDIATGSSRTSASKRTYSRTLRFVCSFRQFSTAHWLRDSTGFHPSLALVTTLPMFAVVYQAINFHHYVVDAMIWKVRKKSLRQNFGIAYSECLA